MKLRALSAVTQEPALIWHRRMGHASPDIVTSMMNDRRYGLTARESDANGDICVETKQSKAPATGKLVEDSENVTLHIDICGPLPVRSLGANSYCITITKTPNWHTHLQTLQTREETPKSCFDHIAWIDRNGNKSVKRVHGENAKRFLGMRKVLT